MKTPPSRPLLAKLIELMGKPVRSVLRNKGDLYVELGLEDDALSDDALLDAMIANPSLSNRPIVVSPKGLRLCRPAEEVLHLLP